MNVKTFSRTAAAVLIGTATVFAQTDPEELEMEMIDLSGGEEKVVDKIETQFSDFSGDETETLVKSLRTGDSLSYVIEVEQPVLDEEGNPVLVEVEQEDGTVIEVEQTEIVEETVVVDNTAGPLGFGGVVLAMGLAEASLPEGAAYADIVNVLFDMEAGEGILDMRASGMGWGRIYQAYDLKVGEVMRSIRSARPDKVNQAVRGRPEHAARPEKVMRPNKPQRPEKPQKPEKPAKPERPNKPQKPAHAGRR